MKEFNGTKTEEKIITNRQTERQREDGTNGQNEKEEKKGQIEIQNQII